MIRIGVDVGGTGIQIGVVNREYKIIQESSIPTASWKNSSARFQNVFSTQSGNRVFQSMISNP